MDTKSKLIYAVDQVLLMHDGPIHEFTLSLVRSDQRVKIDPILIHLSRKTSVKKLKLDFGRAWYRLPSSICSFRQLTDLCLIGCYFDQYPTFNGFGNLTNLYLQGEFISTKTLQHLLSSCPLLKTVILKIPGLHVFWSDDSPTFMELYECLPVFKDFFRNISHGRVPRELPNPLYHLKYVTINSVSFSHYEELILALLFKSSPNMEKLMILDEASHTSSESSARDEWYPGIMLEHLNELEIRNFITCDKTRFDFVKLILARSPVLKKVTIFPHYNYRDEKFKISEILLGYSRASPEVQIIVEDPHNWYLRRTPATGTAALVAP